MFKKIQNDLPIWQFDGLSSFSAEIDHFVSGREGGVSCGGLNALNLSYSVNDLEENVRVNRAKVAYAMGIEPNKLIFPHQTHSANIKVVEEDYNSYFSDTDALVTNKKGICIAVMSADCVPVLLYDVKNKVAAAVHAGWRGTVAGILSKTIALMVDRFHTAPSDLLAGIGPSICKDVYEVGEEVLDQVEAFYREDAGRIITKSQNGKGFIDLWQANKVQLLTAGVHEAHIEIAGLCTYLNDKDFFSARKSANSGRFAAGIILK
jgi:polyphenol oxidase